MTEQLPEHFESPVYQALVEPILWAGVPRTFGIFNCCLTLAAVVSPLHWWWYLPIGLGLHYAVRQITKYDVHVISIILRALRYRDYYES